MIKTIAVTTFAALLLVPATVRAQGSLGGWRGLNVSALDTIYVTDDAGRQKEGKLLRLDPDALVFLINGMEQRIERERVMKIEKRGDSLKNGTLIGVGIGVALGLVTAGISDCAGDDPGGSCVGGRIVLFAVSTGMYAAIGAGVDALIVGRTRVFDAERKSATARSVSGPQLAFRISW